MANDNTQQDPFKEVREYLKTAEGFSPTPYEDNGRLSIGYGTLAEGPDDIVTEEEAAVRMRAYLQDVSYPELRDIYSNFDELPPHVQFGLLNQNFNMGGTNQRKFVNQIKAVEAGDFEKAAEETLASKWFEEQNPGRAQWTADMIRKALQSQDEPDIPVMRAMTDDEKAYHHAPLGNREAFAQYDRTKEKEKSPYEYTRTGLDKMEKSDENQRNVEVLPSEEVEAQEAAWEVAVQSKNQEKVFSNLRVATPNNVYETLARQEGFEDAHYNVSNFLDDLISLEIVSYKANGDEFTEQQQKEFVAKFYQDVMFQLNQPVGSFVDKDGNPKLESDVIAYANSAEGKRELEAALEWLQILKHDPVAMYNPEHDELRDKIRGTGLTDPNLYGFTEEEYARLPLWAKIGYNSFVSASEAGRWLLGGVGIEFDKRLRAEVAPIGEFTGAMAAFMFPYMGAKRLLQPTKLIKKLGRWKSEMLYGAIADLTVTGHEGNISAMMLDMSDHPSMDNWVTQFLATNPDDSLLVQKLKAVPEGMVIDRAMAGIFLGLKFGKRTLKEFPKLREFLGEKGVAAFKAVSDIRPVTAKGKLLKTRRLFAESNETYGKRLQAFTEAFAETLEDATVESILNIHKLDGKYPEDRIAELLFRAGKKEVGPEDIREVKDLLDLKQVNEMLKFSTLIQEGKLWRGQGGFINFGGDGHALFGDFEDNELAEFSRSIITYYHNKEGVTEALRKVLPERDVKNTIQSYEQNLKGAWQEFRKRAKSNNGRDDGPDFFDMNMEDMEKAVDIFQKDFEDVVSRGVFRGNRIPSDEVVDTAAEIARQLKMCEIELGFRSVAPDATERLMSIQFLEKWNEPDLSRVEKRLAARHPQGGPVRAGIPGRGQRVWSQEVASREINPHTHLEDYLQDLLVRDVAPPKGDPKISFPRAHRLAGLIEEALEEAGQIMPGVKGVDRRTVTYATVKNASRQAFENNEYTLRRLLEEFQGVRKKVGLKGGNAEAIAFMRAKAKELGAEWVEDVIYLSPRWDKGGTVAPGAEGSLNKVLSGKPTGRHLNEALEAFEDGIGLMREYSDKLRGSLEEAEERALKGIDPERTVDPDDPTGGQGDSWSPKPPRKPGGDGGFISFGGGRKPGASRPKKSRKLEQELGINKVDEIGIQLGKIIVSEDVKTDDFGKFILKGFRKVAAYIKATNKLIDAGKPEALFADIKDKEVFSLFSENIKSLIRAGRDKVNKALKVDVEKLTDEELDALIKSAFLTLKKAPHAQLKDPKGLRDILRAEQIYRKEGLGDVLSFKEYQEHPIIKQAFRGGKPKDGQEGFLGIGRRGAKAEEAHLPMQRREPLKQALIDYHKSPKDAEARARLEWEYYQAAVHTLDKDSRQFKLLENIQPMPGAKEGAELEESARYREWSRRNKLSGRATADDIAKRLEEFHGSGGEKLPKKKDLSLKGSKLRRAVGAIADLRTVNLLSSFGIPVTAAVGGAFNKFLFRFENGFGRAILEAFSKDKQLKAKIQREKKSLKYMKDAQMDRRARIEELEGEGMGFSSSPRDWYEDMKVAHPAWANLLYALTGGNPKNIEEGLDTFFKSLFNLSSPSIVDPHFIAQSEQALGANLKGGFNPDLGFDPGGLSRMGAWAQGLEDPRVRTAAVALVNFLEILPKKAMGAVDEYLKTNTYTREVASRLHETLLRHFELKSVKVIEGDKFSFIIEDLMRAFTNKIEEVPEVQKSIIEDIRLLVTEEYDLHNMTPVERARAKRTLDSQVGELQNVLKEVHEESLQQARRVTITQDVPEALEAFVKGMQSNPLARIGITPFARAATNIAVMGIERTPVVNLILKNEWEALRGMRGVLERQRAWGKMASGTLATTVGWLLWDSEEEDKPTLHMSVDDKGMFADISLKVPVGEDVLGPALDDYYEINQEQIDEAAKDAGMAPMAYLKSNLPYKEGEGFLELKFDRLAPLGGLIERGALFAELFNASRIKSVKDLENDREFNEDFSNLVDSLIGNSVYSHLGLLGEMARKDANLSDVLLLWAMDTLSQVLPGTRTTKTPGEIGTAMLPASRPKRRDLKAPFERTIVDPFIDEPMLARDFLGRALPRSSRFGFFVGTNADIDNISHELEFLNIYKPPLSPTQIPYSYGQDWSKYKLKKKLNNSEKETLKGLPLADAVNAYDALLVLTGSHAMPEGKTLINKLHTYFKSERYLAMKALVEDLRTTEGLSPVDEQRMAQQLGTVVDRIKKDINNWIGVGRENALKALISPSAAALFVNEDGETLAEGRKKAIGTLKEGNINFREYMEGLENPVDTSSGTGDIEEFRALLEGGNK